MRDPARGKSAADRMHERLLRPWWGLSPPDKENPCRSGERAGAKGFEVFRDTKYNGARSAAQHLSGRVSQ